MSTEQSNNNKTTRLEGIEAIEYAEANGLTLSKYADPVEDARENLTPDEARQVASEDPRLVWIEVPMRSAARQSLAAALPEAARYAHELNHWKLHVYRDGRVAWTEHHERTDDIIDRDAATFAPIPSVAMVGTGATDCDCDFCSAFRDGQYDTHEAAIADAVADIDSADLADLEAAMVAEFDFIPVGYFNDEVA